MNMRVGSIGYMSLEEFILCGLAGFAADEPDQDVLGHLFDWLWLALNDPVENRDGLLPRFPPKVLRLHAEGFGILDLLGHGAAIRFALHSQDAFPLHIEPTGHLFCGYIPSLPVFAEIESFFGVRVDACNHPGNISHSGAVDDDRFGHSAP